jgi:hypothetical protein
MADPPRPSTFLESDFNMVIEDQCQFHCDAKHTMRKCEKLKHALGVAFDSKKTKSNNNDARTAASASAIVTVNLIDVIFVITDPILAMMTGFDVIVIATIAVMTYATTTVAMTEMTGRTTTGVIAVTTSVMTDEKIDAMIDVAKTITTATTITGKSGLHCHRQKGATPMVHSSWPTERSTSSSAVAKRPKATERTDQTQGRSGMSIPKSRSLCDSLNSQLLSP